MGKSWIENISEKEFWQKIVSEFIHRAKLVQESYNCLNAFLEVSEIIEMLNGELSPEEYESNIELRF